jgi:hypothetical protein
LPEAQIRAGTPSGKCSWRCARADRSFRARNAPQECCRSNPASRQIRAGPFSTTMPFRRRVNSGRRPGAPIWVLRRDCGVAMAGSGGIRRSGSVAMPWLGRSFPCIRRCRGWEHGRSGRGGRVGEDQRRGRLAGRRPVSRVSIGEDQRRVDAGEVRRVQREAVRLAWSPGRLVAWSPGRLVAWSPGRLVAWSPGRLVAWSPGRLVAVPSRAGSTGHAAAPNSRPWRAP